MSNETIKPNMGTAHLVRAQLVRGINAPMHLSSTRAENDMAYLPNIYEKRYESFREGQRAKLQRKAQPVLRLVRENKCTNVFKLN